MYLLHVIFHSSSLCTTFLVVRFQLIVSIKIIQIDESLLQARGSLIMLRNLVEILDHFNVVHIPDEGKVR